MSESSYNQKYEFNKSYQETRRNYLPDRINFHAHGLRIAIN